jgi:small subunit ribosomal protein S2
MEIPYNQIADKPWSEIPDSLKSVLGDETTQIQINSTTTSNQFPNLKPTPDYKPYSEQELYLRQLSHSRQSGNLGSRLTNIYNPRDDVLNPTKLQDTTIATLLAAGCHLGHAKPMWRPSTQPFIYGEYDGIHIIDLNETITALKRACNIIKGVSRKGGIVLFVGTGSKNFQKHRALEEAAGRSKGYYVSKRWIPGTITNFTEVTKQITGESKVEIDMENTPTGRKLPESSELIKPDLVVLLNPVENRNCINECTSSRIPTIGLCDTDMEPSLLTYPIPCNDDSVRAQTLILGVLSRAAEEGVNERIESFQNYAKAKAAPAP